jgi:hypothetical protein
MTASESSPHVGMPWVPEIINPYQAFANPNGSAKSLPDICFYVGPSCQAFFVVQLEVKAPIPEPKVKRPSLRRRPAPGKTKPEMFEPF